MFWQKYDLMWLTYGKYSVNHSNSIQGENFFDLAVALERLINIFLYFNILPSKGYWFLTIIKISFKLLKYDFATSFYPFKHWKAAVKHFKMKVPNISMFLKWKY